MSQLRGFDTVFEVQDEQLPPGVRPGTMSHLRYVEKQKREEMEKAKTVHLKDPSYAEQKPVDNSLLITLEPALKSKAPTKAPLETKPPSISEAPLESEGGLDGEVLVELNYMRFDMDIFSILPDLSGAEAKIYLNLICRSYGQQPARNICSCTNPIIAKSTGITSSATLAKAMLSLETKGFIKRLFTARKMNERSLYRIYLPGERPGETSRTVITFKK